MERGEAEGIRERERQRTHQRSRNRLLPVSRPPCVEGGRVMPSASAIRQYEQLVQRPIKVGPLPLRHTRGPIAAHGGRHSLSLGSRALGAPGPARGRGVRS